MGFSDPNPGLAGLVFPAGSLAVPIVAVGALLGVYVCSLMPRMLVVRTLIALILIELLSSLLLIPLTLEIAVASVGLFLGFSGCTI